MTKVGNYEVNGNTLTQNSFLHEKTGNAFIVVEEIENYTTYDENITELKVQSKMSEKHWICQISELLTYIEDNNLSLVSSKTGSLGYLVPLSAILFTFKKGSLKKEDQDQWQIQKLRIIEQSGGLWSLTKLEAWKNKFVGKRAK